MRLRFTIRDLLWLTALAAVLVAWWLDRNHLVLQRDYWQTRSHVNYFDVPPP